MIASMFFEYAKTLLGNITETLNLLICW